jgi:uncharacterized protein YkwD
MSVFLLLTPTLQHQKYSGLRRDTLAFQPRLFTAAASSNENPGDGPVVSSAGKPPSGAPSGPNGLQGCGGLNVPPQNPQFEQRVVELVNDIRMQNGKPPLKRSAKLDHSARFHATDMAQDDYFAHNTFDRVNGNLVEVCDVWSRIATFYPAASGENLGVGYPTPEEVVQGWMESPGHRDDLLSSDHMEMGVGFYNFYWALDFGAGEAPTALIINGEHDVASTPSVSLYVYGSWQDMRLRNDSEGWTGWQAFRPSLTWEINPTPGSHTVGVEVRREGVTISTSDTINVPGDSLLALRKLYLPQMLFTPQLASPNPYP